MSKISVPGVVHGAPKIELAGKAWTPEALLLAYLAHGMADSVGSDCVEIDAKKLMSFVSRVRGMIVENPGADGSMKIRVQADAAIEDETIEDKEDCDCCDGCGLCELLASVF